MLPASRDQRRVHVVREAETDPRAQRFIARPDPQPGRRALHHPLRRGPAARHGPARRPAPGRDRGPPGRPSALRRADGGGEPLRPRPPLPVGPAALARAAGVPIVPVFVFREGRCATAARSRAPSRWPRAPTARRDVGDALQRFAAELEAAIRRTPHQWFCFRSLWPRERRRM